MAVAARGDENIPNPDPSALTTEQLYREIGTLEKLLDAKIDLINERFTGVNARLLDGKQAVDKAFDSSEKAIGKTEMAFTKQIEASDSKINDVKERLTILESRTQGQREGIGAVGALIVGTIGGFATMLSIATLVYNIFAKH